MDYIEAFQNLKTNQKYSRKSPHKAVLLLTVIRLYERGLLSDNEIKYDNTLTETFVQVWNRLLPTDTKLYSDAYLPFWYLQNESFWHVIPIRGRESILQLMRDEQVKPSETKLLNFISYAELDEELFFLLSMPSSRRNLKQALLETYFSLSDHEIITFLNSTPLQLSQQMNVADTYKKAFIDVKDKTSGFLGLSEDVKISLSLEYFTYLKNHRYEREEFMRLFPSVEYLYERITENPLRSSETSSYFEMEYSNFLRDLKLSLMSEDEAMDFIESIDHALDVLENETTEESISKTTISQDDSQDVQSGDAASIELTRELIEAARTPNGGFTKSQLAAIGINWPPPQDWIQDKIGTMITPSQLEEFNHIEYVVKANAQSSKKGKRTYLDVANNGIEKKRMEAVLGALSHYDVPVTPRDIARSISPSEWDGYEIREDTIDSLLKRMPEVEYIQWGKYILKSKLSNYLQDHS